MCLLYRPMCWRWCVTTWNRKRVRQQWRLILIKINWQHCASDIILRNRVREEGLKERVRWTKPQELTRCCCYLKSSTIGGETLEDLSLTSFDDTLEPPPVPGAASTVTASNCSSEVKLIPKKDSSFSAPATSTKQVLFYHRSKTSRPHPARCWFFYSGL